MVNYVISNTISVLKNQICSTGGLFNNDPDNRGPLWI